MPQNGLRGKSRPNRAHGPPKDLAPTHNSFVCLIEGLTFWQNRVVFWEPPHPPATGAHAAFSVVRLWAGAGAPNTFLDTPCSHLAGPSSEDFFLKTRVSSWQNFTEPLKFNLEQTSVLSDLTLPTPTPATFKTSLSSPMHSVQTLFSPTPPILITLHPSTLPHRPELPEARAALGFAGRLGVCLLQNTFLREGT